jgi:predicted RNase H-like HicB family nuclease
MKVTILVHPDEEGGYWAEIPGMPNCVSEGDTLEEVKHNIAEALSGILNIDHPLQETEPGYEVHQMEV